MDSKNALNTRKSSFALKINALELASVSFLFYGENKSYLQTMG